MTEEPSDGKDPTPVRNDVVIPFSSLRMLGKALCQLKCHSEGEKRPKNLVPAILLVP